MHYIAVGADPRPEEGWRDDAVSILLQLVAVVVCGRGGVGGDGRVVVGWGAVFLDDYREVVECVNALMRFSLDLIYSAVLKACKQAECVSEMNCLTT